jgi:predicted DNA-binding transcriptional regulator AlpA
MMDPKGVGRRGSGRWARNKQTADYLGVSAMTLWRWKNNPDLGFPPATVINNIERNDLDAVDEWMRSRAVSRLKEMA